MDNDFIIRTEKLNKFFPVRGGFLGLSKQEIKAVNEVTLSIRKGENFGLVGESGCGKTTFGRTILRLLQPTSGSVWFDGVDLSRQGSDALSKLRKEMQIIFQDPYSSLNPRLTVLDIVTEGLIEHGIINKADKVNKAEEILRLVGLDASYIYRYPHEFSGGQRQRINIARAISLKPKFVVCDEVVSALDVSIRAQILELLLELKTRLNLSYLFISHDLAVVRYVCDRLAVMYLGRIVERGPADEIFRKPLHPYTQSLMSAIPEPDPDKKVKFYQNPVAGEVPSLISQPPGCPFHPRCAHVMPECKSGDVFEQDQSGHFVRCNLYG